MKKVLIKASGKLVAAFCALLLLFCLGAGLALYFSARPPLLDDIAFGKVVLDSRGRLLKIGLTSDEKYRLPVKLEEVPQYAINALIRYEDQYFYSHPGINPFSILKSLASLFGAGRKTGASTITMQVARLKGKIRSASISGKLRQIWHALMLERHYSKAQILEAYFNLAPYGGNIEGLEAASRVYFNKRCSSLTALEIQALTVIPQNPVKRNPLGGEQFNSARDNLAFLLDEKTQKDKLPPLAIRKPGDIKTIAPHLAMELLAERQESTIETFIERDLQTMLEATLKNYTEKLARYGLENAAAIIVNADNMQVVASQGSGNFFNASISGQIDGTRARRSPGSTLKPFIYALALDQGIIHPATILADSPRSWGGYDPENFDQGFRGPIAAADALRQSRNLPAIYLTEQLRYPGLYDFLRQADISFPHGPEYYGLALALGGAEISMRQLAALYAMLLNQGLWQSPRLTKNDAVTAPRRLLSPEASWLALWMLERPNAFIRNYGAKLPCRYKTGTSNGFRDAWTAGTLGNHVIIVWLGHFDNSPNPLLTGAKSALPLFLELANGLSSLRRLSDRQQQLYARLNLDKAEMCESTGDFASGQCENTIESYFIPGVSPIRDTGILRPILVDKATGLRACQERPGQTEERMQEFWPSDLRQIFAQAGIHKPEPPDWLPECKKNREQAQAKPPRILSPKKNVVYYKEKDTFRVPLNAAADADAGFIHWYAGSEYIGKCRPGETIFWQPHKLSDMIIAAVDEHGQSSKILCRLGNAALP